MPEADKVVDMNLTSSLERTTSLIENLGKTFAELEAQEDSCIDNIPWKDVEGHFRYLGSVMKKKLVVLDAKEKEVTEKELLLAEREAVVTAKEQDLLDRMQELKDAAVSAIMEARAVYKVSCFDNYETAEEKHRAEVVAAELREFCERMDSKGLLNFVMENLNDLSAVCRKQLSFVLVSATEPARLVLDALEGFFPPNELAPNGDDRDNPLHGMRQSCLLLMEALCAFLARAGPSADNFLNPEIKQIAKAIAGEWKPKLALESTSAANGKSLEARALLRLLVTFRIASEFDEEELCKYVLATAHHRQATELCRPLELSQKIPGIVKTLIGNGRNIEAVNFILSFQLSEAFPPVPLLKAYLKELRRNLQGNGDAETQNNYNAQELAAIKSVMRCVKEYKLEADYPLDQLRKRFVQLQNSVSDRKRKREKGKRRQNGSQDVKESHEMKVRVSESTRHNPPPFLGEGGAYTGLTERHSSACPSAYNYPLSSQIPYAAQANDRGTFGYTLSSQSTYAAQVNDENPYHYSQADRASVPYSTTAASYSAYTQPPQPPYM